MCVFNASEIKVAAKIIPFHSMACWQKKNFPNKFAFELQIPYGKLHRKITICENISMNGKR